MALGKALGGAATGGLKAAGGAAALGTGAFLRQAASPIPGGAAAMTAMMGITGAMASGAMKGFGGGNGKDPAAKQQSIGNEKLEELRTGIHSLIKINTEGFKDVRVMRGYMEDMRKLAYEEARNRLKKIQKPAIAATPMSLKNMGQKTDDDGGGMGILPFVIPAGLIAAAAALTNLFDKLKAFALRVPKWLDEKWKNVGTRFGNLFRTLRNWGAEKTKGIGHWLREGWEKVRVRFSRLFSTLRGWGADKASGIGHWLREGWYNVKGQFSKMFTTLRGWGTSIGTWLGEGWDEVKGRFVKFFGADGTLRSWSTSIGNWLGEKGNALKGNVVGKFKLFFGQGGTLSKWATQLDEFAKTKGNAFGGFLSRLGGLFDDLIERIRAKVPGLKPTVDDPDAPKSRKPSIFQKGADFMRSLGKTTSGLFAGSQVKFADTRATMSRFTSNMKPTLGVSKPPNLGNLKLGPSGNVAANMTAANQRSPYSNMANQNKGFRGLIKEKAAAGQKHMKAAMDLIGKVPILGRLIKAVPLIGTAMMGWEAWKILCDEQATEDDKLVGIMGLAGGLGGAIFGAKAGLIAGAFGGPLAPITAPLGAIGGALAGWMGGQPLAEWITAIAINHKGKRDKYLSKLNWVLGLFGADVPEQYGDYSAMAGASAPVDLAWLENMSVSDMSEWAGTEGQQARKDIKAAMASGYTEQQAFLKVGGMYKQRALAKADLTSSPGYEGPTAESSIAAMRKIEANFQGQRNALYMATDFAYPAAPPQSTVNTDTNSDQQTVPDKKKEESGGVLSIPYSGRTSGDRFDESIMGAPLLM